MVSRHLVRFQSKISPNATIKSLELEICGISESHLVRSTAKTSPNATKMSADASPFGDISHQTPVLRSGGYLDALDHFEIGYQCRRKHIVKNRYFCVISMAFGEVSVKDLTKCRAQITRIGDLWWHLPSFPWHLVRFQSKISPNATIKSLELEICGISESHLVRSTAKTSPNATKMSADASPFGDISHQTPVLRSSGYLDALDHFEIGYQWFPDIW